MENNINLALMGNNSLWRAIYFNFIWSGLPEIGLAGAAPGAISQTWKIWSKIIKENRISSWQTFSADPERFGWVSVEVSRRWGRFRRFLSLSQLYNCIFPALWGGSMAGRTHTSLKTHTHTHTIGRAGLTPLRPIHSSILLKTEEP